KTSLPGVRGKIHKQLGKRSTRILSTKFDLLHRNIFGTWPSEFGVLPPLACQDLKGLLKSGP
ncbi:MAG TPA: hypothetical protein VG897_14150, partial [Terriglobales bacterium]|nr:hypothetical protein [Terriglobales bacterium]